MDADPAWNSKGGVDMKKLFAGLLVIFTLGALRSRKMANGGHRQRFEMRTSSI